MQAVIPIDVEHALSDDLAAIWGHAAYAPPVPAAYPDGLPCACVTEVGGADTTMVTYEHDVSIDVWAPTWGAAMDEARKLVGILRDLPYRAHASGRQWLTAGINTMPYANPDPNDYKTPRVSFTALLTIRGDIIDG